MATNVNKPTTEKQVCALCSKDFKFLKNLNAHMNLHEKRGKFQCCKKIFKDKSTFTCHQANQHGGQKPYVCSTCGKDFALKCDLSRHERYEKRLNLKKCDTCGYEARDNSVLRVHMSSHSGEKLHFCPICNKRFGYHGNLSRHMNSHK